MTGKPISSFQTQFEAGRIPEDWKVIGIRREKSVENFRISARVKLMIKNGLVDEVKSLLGEDEPLSKQARSAIGYAEIIDYLDGQITLEKAVEKIKVNTRRLAKAQRTWFKTFKQVSWLDIAEDEPANEIMERTMELLEVMKQ